MSFRDATSRIATAALVGACVVACGGGGAGDARYPKRPEGCDVALYRDVPSGATDNIGPVHAACDESVSPDDCVRTLKDVVCKMGGDVVWGVDGPDRKDDGKIHYSGRAAHTKAARSRQAQ
jgi:hypothetical protein